MGKSSIVMTAASVLLSACTHEPPPEPQSPVHRQAQPAGPPVAAASTPKPAQPIATQQHTRPSELFRHVLQGAPPPATRFDPEAARSAARAASGARSVTWIDPLNLLVRVNGAQRRNHQMIDGICTQLQSLGDAQAVVVHLQNANARSSEELVTLSRPCQASAGVQPQPPSTGDGLGSAVREQAHADGERTRALKPREQTAGDRAALKAIPEM